MVILEYSDTYHKSKKHNYRYAKKSRFKLIQVSENRIQVVKIGSKTPQWFDKSFLKVVN